MSKNFIRLFLGVGVLVPFVLLFMGMAEKGKKNPRGRLPEKPFVIVIPSYNNAKYCEQNLLSVLGQEYGNFRVIYLDDASTDGTWGKVEAAAQRSPLKGRIKLVRRDHNVGSLQNLYEAIRSCKDEEIIVRVDGDDFLAHPFVLKKLNKVYADQHVWMTYGNYLDYPTYHQNPKLCEKFPSHVIRRGTFRKHKWVSTHLQTFYAGLFKKVSVEHLMREGVFMPMAGDVALLLPLLEMAGPHIRYINEVLYLYNRVNPISDHKKDLKLQSACEGYVRSLPAYSPLEQPPYE